MYGDQLRLPNVRTGTYTGMIRDDYQLKPEDNRVGSKDMFDARRARVLYSAPYEKRSHSEQIVPAEKKASIHISWLHVLKLPTSDGWK
jgi:hypothetical protein